MFLSYLTQSTKATKGSNVLNQFDFYFPMMDFENETEKKKSNINLNQCTTYAIHMCHLTGYDWTEN